MASGDRRIITIEPSKRGGRPCIGGMRIAVPTSRLAHRRMTHEAILGDYPELMEDDIRTVLAYAADRERRAATAAAISSG